MTHQILFLGLGQRSRNKPAASVVTGDVIHGIFWDGLGKSGPDVGYRPASELS